MARIRATPPIDGVLFFQDLDRPERHERAPAPPAALLDAGAPALRLTLHRSGAPGADVARGGGLLTALIDLAPADERLARAEVELRARGGFAPCEVADVLCGAGEARLYLGDRLIATAALAAGAPPVAALAASLSVEWATLLARSEESAASPLSVTVRRGVGVVYEGPPLRVQADAAAAARMTDPVTEQGLPARLSALRAAGVIRLEAPTPLEAWPPVVDALLAGALFEPAPAPEQPWSGVPGLGLMGVLVPRAGGTVMWTLTPGAVIEVPLLGAARLPAIPSTGTTRIVRPGTPISTCSVVLAGAIDRLEAATLHVALPDGSERTVVMHQAQKGHALELAWVAPAGLTAPLRWRYELLYTDGTTQEVDAGETDNRVLVVGSGSYARLQVLAPWLQGSDAFAAVEVDIEAAGARHTLMIHRAEGQPLESLELGHVTPPLAYRVRFRYLRTDGGPPVERDWQDASDPVFVVPVPPPA